MSRYRIVFRVEDANGKTVMRERSIPFEADGASFYEHLSGAILIIAKLVKAALIPTIGQQDAATSRP